ncbi:MAG: hypothetical protein PVG39_18440 [Desulfobacteraceae bacterium]|jgi:hypothetical protein
MVRWGKGKKDKHKKKKKSTYNKKEFKNTVCQSCALCTKPDPTFCYGELYKADPIDFMKYTYSQLVSFYGDIGLVSQSEFSYITGRYRKEDYFAFLAQVQENNLGGSKRGRKKRKERYVCQPYMTHFHSNNAEFISRIENILSGDNNIKQNTDKELPESDKEQLNRDSESTQP